MKNEKLRPNFYIEHEEKVRAIIADVITQYANGEIDYTKAEFDARVKIYQFVSWVCQVICVSFFRDNPKFCVKSLRSLQNDV